jgi:hypothetical protein
VLYVSGKELNETIFASATPESGEAACIPYVRDSPKEEPSRRIAKKTSKPVSLE